MQNDQNFRLRRCPRIGLGRSKVFPPLFQKSGSRGRIFEVLCVETLDVTDPAEMWLILLEHMYRKLTRKIVSTVGVDFEKIDLKVGKQIALGEALSKMGGGSNYEHGASVT